MNKPKRLIRDFFNGEQYSTIYVAVLVATLIFGKLSDQEMFMIAVIYGFISIIIILEQILAALQKGR